jgi:hypothetical protein
MRSENLEETQKHVAETIRDLEKTTGLAAKSIEE